MFERGSVVHSLVQFASLTDAKNARNNLHGANIYPDCCTVKVEYAKQEVLSVKSNTDRSRDYTVAVNGENNNVINGDTGKGKISRRVLINEMPPPKAALSLLHIAGPSISPSSDDSLHGLGTRSERSPVIIVYNLDMERFNCKKLFNLLSLYGNVNKINFLRNREGSAMVEFASSQAASLVIRSLNNMFIFGNRINIEESKKMYVEDIRRPYTLQNGDKSFENFINDRNNRFNTPSQAAKNRLVPPTKILHFFNVPDMSDDAMMDIFSDSNAPFPTKVTWFESKSAKGAASGILEFETVEEAMEALVIANNIEIEPEGGGRFFVLKLCFTRS